jgi:hypothetical protein
LEKQSTNLITYSEQFDNAAWTKLNGSVTANIAVSPDGTSNADAFIPNTTSGVHALRSNLFNQSATASHSWFVKANGYTKIAVRESELVGNYATFNLATGTLISTNQTGSIQNLGNGWYRCTLVDTTTGVNAQTSVVVLPDSYTSGDPIVVNWSGDGTKGVFAWGAQVEISSYPTYPTSYIPTTSASATRVADDITNTFLQSGGFLGSDKGAMFVSGIPYSLLNNQVLNFVLTADNNTTKAFLFDTISNQIRIRTWDASSNMQSLTSGTITGNYKLCVSWTSSSIKFFVNGSLIGTISQTIYPYTTIKPESTSYSNNIWSQLTFFANNLADADAIALTTL